MTFEQAKAKADKIGGVVDWWWSYSVYTAPEWKAFNGTHGYGVYVSKKVEKYFAAEYRKARRQKAKEVKEIIKKIKAGISPWSKTS